MEEIERRKVEEEMETKSEERKRGRKSNGNNTWIVNKYQSLPFSFLPDIIFYSIPVEKNVSTKMCVERGRKNFEGERKNFEGRNGKYQKWEP